MMIVDSSLFVVLKFRNPMSICRILELNFLTHVTLDGEGWKTNFIYWAALISVKSCFLCSPSLNSAKNLPASSTALVCLDSEEQVSLLPKASLPRTPPHLP